MIIVSLCAIDPLCMLAYQRQVDHKCAETLPMTFRTTHRSSSGKKLYAVRDKNGRFKDIQTYERAHRADLKRKSKAEKSSRH